MRLKISKKARKVRVIFSYDPLWKTLKEKGISTYKLLTVYGVSRGTLDALKHNRSVTMNTIDALCKILSCRIEDIAVYIPDEEQGEVKKPPDEAT